MGGRYWQSESVGNSNDACVTAETMTSTLSRTIRRKRSEPIKLPVRKSVFDEDVLPHDIAKVPQPALEFVVVGQWPGRGRTR